LSNLLSNSTKLRKIEDAAKELGIKSIVLSGQKGTELEALSDIYICAPAESFADRVQESHIKVLHIFIELIERAYHPENY